MVCFLLVQNINDISIVLCLYVVVHWWFKTSFVFCHFVTIMNFESCSCLRILTDRSVLQVYQKVKILPKSNSVQERLFIENWSLSKKKFCLNITVLHWKYRYIFVFSSIQAPLKHIHMHMVIDSKILSFHKTILDKQSNILHKSEVWSNLNKSDPI